MGTGHLCMYTPTITCAGTVMKNAFHESNLLYLYSTTTAIKNQNRVLQCQTADTRILIKS